MSRPSPDDLLHALERGDVAGVAALVEAAPALAWTRLRWPLTDGKFGKARKNSTAPLCYVSHLRFNDVCPDADLVALARVLVEAGAPIEGREPGEQAESALQHAVSLHEPELAAHLIDWGADLEAQGGCVMNGTPLVLAAQFGSTLSLDLLVAAGAQVFHLPLAAASGDVERMRTFLDADGQLGPEAGARHPRDTNEEPLFEGAEALLQRAVVWAAIHNRAAAVDECLRLGASLETLVDGATVLHWVAWFGDPAIAPHLIERGADPRATDAQHGSTPARWAAHKGRGAVAAALEALEG